MASFKLSVPLKAALLTALLFIASGALQQVPCRGAETLSKKGSSNSPQAARSASTPESREFKVLLLPDNFSKPTKGMVKFWEKATKTAKELGYKVKQVKSLKPEPKRFVTYLDTPSYDFRKRGLILRRRGDQPFTSDKWELVLKARSEDPSQALSANVAAASGYDSESSFEEDVSMKTASSGTCEAQRFFSRSESVEISVIPGESMEAVQNIFPGLAGMKLAANSPVSSVRDIHIREYRLKPGAIDFGPINGKVTLTVWQVVGEKKPWIAEFSFSYDVPDNQVIDGTVTQRALEYCRVLMEKNSSWLASGMTKTALVYGK